MDDKKNVKQDVAKNVKSEKKPIEKTKEEKPQFKNTASRILMFAKEGKYTKKEIAKLVFDSYAKEKITENVRGKPIVEKNILAQIGALFMCFNNYQTSGNPRKGWWEKWVAVIDEKTKIVTVKERVPK